jgi:hypothetical protein
MLAYAIGVDAACRELSTPVSVMNNIGASGPASDPEPSPEGAAGAAVSSAHTSRSAQAQLDRHAATLICRAIDLAERGNVVALRLCIERILPARKDRAVWFDLPPIESAADAAKIMGAVIAAMARGEVTPSEVNEIARPIDIFIKTLIAAKIETNVANLQTALESESGTTQ